MSLIRLDNICKHYMVGDSRLEVLKDVSITIERGEFVALTGVSGSGKTTLMNIIGFLDTLSSGTYRFDGEDVSHLDDDELSRLRNRRIGFIFQSFYLVPYSSVLENVLLPAYYAGTDIAAMTPRAVSLLEGFGLGDRLKSRPNQLSGGQQQRVAIARALINEPDVILADEPTGQLDSATSEVIMEHVTGLARQGTTVVVVTHDATTSAYAERRVDLVDGRLAEAPVG